jgi:hypothetical protein
MKKVNLFLVSLATMVALSVGFSSCGAGEMEEKGWSFILNHLRSPGSATLIKYGYGDDIKKIVEQHCKTTLPACITVGFFEYDAQNGFGALLRQSSFVFYKNGTPCHVESDEDLDEVASIGRSDVLILALESNNCGCK